MRTILFTAALFSMVALPFSESAPAAELHAVVEQASSALPQLRAQSDLADSAALHTIGEFLTGATVVEAPRRLVAIRLPIAPGSVSGLPADEFARTALLKLREAKRERLAIVALLEWDASGAASFHTATPPPTTHA